MFTPKHESGCQNRKAKEGEIKNISKLPKLDSYFSKKGVYTTGEDARPSHSSSEDGADKSQETRSSDSELSEHVGEKEAELEYCSKSSESGQKLVYVGLINDMNVVETESNTITETCAESTAAQKNDTLTSDRGHFHVDIGSSELKRLIIAKESYRPKGPLPWEKHQDFCEPCWLFGNRQSSFIATWVNGIKDWRHLTQKIQEHKCAKTHLDACLLMQRWRLNKTIDEQNENEKQKEIKFWRDVLERITNVSLTLAFCNLPFTGHRESFDKL